MKKKLLVCRILALAVAGFAIWSGYKVLSQPERKPLTTPAPQHPQPATYLDGSQFTIGVNYPRGPNCGFGANSWGHYGPSAPECSAKIETDFAQLEALDVRVIRWWLFADFRSGLKLDQKSNVIGVDDYVFPDIDNAVRIADKHNIKIIFVLSDFMLFDKPQMASGVQMFGRRDLIVNPIKRQQLLDNVYKPVFERYGHNSAIIAWDVINEPEWAMYVHTGEWIVHDRINHRIMQAYVTETVDYIHRYTEQWATVGSAKRGLLRFWRHCNLDVYQFHYYYKMERQYRLDYPAAKLKLDRPVFVGEFPSANGHRSVDEYLTIIRRNGYAGAFPWSMNASDPYTSAPEIMRGITQFHGAKP